MLLSFGARAEASEARVQEITNCEVPNRTESRFRCQSGRGERLNRQKRTY